MSETKAEGALCSNSQNHREQLLNHQQEIDQDIEAGSCGDIEGDDEETREEGVEGEEGEEGEGGEGDDGPKKPIAEMPAIYNVEPGCTPLSCYSAILTGIILAIGIVALLMYFSPKNAKGVALVYVKDEEMTTLYPSSTSEPETSSSSQ